MRFEMTSLMTVSFLFYILCWGKLANGLPSHGKLCAISPPVILLL